MTKFQADALFRQQGMYGLRVNTIGKAIRPVFVYPVENILVVQM